MWEGENSSREKFARELERYEKNLAELSQPAESEEQKPESGDVDLAAVREAATADAIAHASAQMAAQQQPVVNPELAAEYMQLRTEAHANFAERVEELKAQVPDFDQIAIKVQQANVNFSPTVVECLTTLANGPDIVLHLGRNLKEAKALARLPDHLAVAKIGALSERFANPRPRRSAAPEPFVHLRGGNTRSTIALGDENESYASFRSRREAEIRARHGRR